ncbi:DUF4864 domain-containing protein [Tabrizicola sp. J26]|uniref:DUF4864 domain-containing protein n=1 Tax=Alitabrizicola rongguiensis TaxID=2909234 RepID=UPI001F2E1848|nr:DUF4864 domain-containing protein [Tabrizicola rongguiensis]MCF1707341.1 DUF4864 domain-containing protein [Tabrizicola rongguiensis]
MRGLTAMLMVTMMVPAALHAQDADQSSAIQQTIESQMDAFRRGDVSGAFKYASPGIEQMFGTPENFGQMVQRGYPMVWSPGDVRFLELRDVAGALWQRVMVTDPDGRSHLLDYQMIPGADGWRINAVQLLKNEGLGA